jgi:hypothetical protein
LLPWDGENLPEDLLELYVLKKNILYKVKIEHEDGSPLPSFPHGTTLSCEYKCSLTDNDVSVNLDPESAAANKVKFELAKEACYVYVDNLSYQTLLSFKFIPGLDNETMLL